MRKFILLLSLLAIASCGLNPKDEIEHQEVRVPKKPNTGDRAAEWGDVQNIVQKSCALSGCHAGSGFVRNGASFKGSNSLERITTTGSRRMPPPSSNAAKELTDDKRRSLVNFLSS